MAFVQPQNIGWSIRKTRKEKLKPLGYPAHPLTILHVYYVWRLFLLCFVLLYNGPWQANFLSDCMYTVHRIPKPITQNKPLHSSYKTAHGKQIQLPESSPIQVSYTLGRLYLCPLRMEPPFPIVQLYNTGSQTILPVWNQNTCQRYMITRKDQTRNVDTKVWSSGRKWMYEIIHY